MEPTQKFVAGDVRISSSLKLHIWRCVCFEVILASVTKNIYVGSFKRVGGGGGK